MVEDPINNNKLYEEDKRSESLTNETKDRSHYIQTLEEEIVELRKENELLRQQIETLKDFN